MGQIRPLVQDSCHPSMARGCGHVLLSSSSLDFWKCQLENPCQALRETQYGIIRTWQSLIFKVLCVFLQVPSEILAPIVLRCPGAQQLFPGPCDLQENGHIPGPPQSDEPCLLPTSLLPMDVFLSGKTDASTSFPNSLRSSLSPSEGLEAPTSLAV